jgi:general secretion pathway protein K
MTRAPAFAPEQQGMAIISALLITAVVAVIAAGMLTRQSAMTRELEAEQFRVRSAWLLQAGAELGVERLYQARERDPLTRRDQAWAQPLLSLPVEQGGGRFLGQLHDEQGKFNLRNLILNGQVDETQVQAFERLCSVLGVDVARCRRISARAIDSYAQRRQSADAEQAAGIAGFDSGRSTSPSANLKPLLPTRPMLRSIDGLLGLDGVDQDLLTLLRPHLTVLPANTWVNGNTASAEVLASQVPGLSVERARSLTAERDGGHWFINRGDFVNRLRLPQLAVESVHVGITSDWFLLQGQARDGQRQIGLQTLIHRDQKQMPQIVWSQVGV